MHYFSVCKNRVIGIPMPIAAMLNKKHRQAVRAMKITAFILLVCTLHVSAGGFSQTISLSEKDVPLTKVFKSIEKQTKYVFFYNTEFIKTTDKVSLEVRNMPLQEVLDLLFKNMSVTYKITGKLITILPKKNDVTASSESQSSPPIDLHGRVVDENGKPVPGVTVTIRGTKKQTITNDNGEFSFSDVESSSVLTFSSVNMEPFTLNVSGQKEILAKLKTKTSELDEVQIIAYGQTTKRLQTGNVFTVKGEDINTQPVTNPLLGLQGRVPGLSITQESGLAGGPVTIRIQGQNSIAKGNDPLIVIDGVPYYSDMPITGNEGALIPNNVNRTNPSALAFINAADIESIDILKDADATSIYGSRAANGAILISTKKGKSGPATVNINIQQGWSQVASKIDMLNTRQYLDMRYEAFKNDGIDWTSPSVNANDLKLWDTTRYTDWQKELIGGTAKYTNINTSLSGGGPAIQYLVGCTYSKSTTVFPGNFANESGGVHFNLNNASANQRLKMELTGSYTTGRNRLPSSDLTQMAVLLEPNAPPLHNTDGSLNWEVDALGSSSWENPLSNVLYRNTDIKTTNLLSNLSASYRLLKHLELKTNIGYSRLQTSDYLASQIGAFVPENRNITPSLRSANYGSRFITSVITEPQVIYNSTILNGKFNAVAGFTFNQQKTETNNFFGSGYSNDGSLRNPQSALSLTASATYSLYKYVAAFSRVSYNWRDKYLINITFRRDGSSRFGDKNKFHNFASVGAGWIFTENAWFQNSLKWLSFGKVKASYGTTGNDQIGDYSYLSTYSNLFVGQPYQNVTSLVSYGLTNPYLQWEETKKAQIGVDLGFLNNRVILSATIQRNRSSNQLLNYELPVITGASGITQNFAATVQNTSWEFMVTTVNMQSTKIKWNSSFNLTIPKNKLLAYQDFQKSSYASGIFGLIVGKPIGIKKAFNSEGVDPTTGQYEFVDSHGNPTNSPDFFNDRPILINPTSRFYGGFQNSFQYKGFQLDLLLQFVKQIATSVFYSASYFAPGNFFAGNSNQPVTVLNRWQKPGDNASVAGFGTQYSPGLSYLSISDAIFEDASFIRLKNASLSWALPVLWKKKLHLQNCRMYTQVQNLLTITNYSGVDPENQTISSLPPLRTITIGAQLTF